ncbi:ESF1 homolog [Protopterus annectens]|uniref:ESF1 homolog n=1 Tax=Protopterus annectens TaxID=7888 RepID=UPI001CFAD418|nr:ESF1 homolog [Protopterus annectens]
MVSKQELENDQRFSKVTKDPRFWEMPEKEHKIKIDKRFQSMFHDKKFKLKYTVDKRGRPVNRSTREDLKHFYDITDSSSVDDSDNEKEMPDVKEEAKKTGKKKLKVKTVNDAEDLSNSIVGKPDKAVKKPIKGTVPNLKKSTTKENDVDVTLAGRKGDLKKEQLVDDESDVENKCKKQLQKGKKKKKGLSSQQLSLLEKQHFQKIKTINTTAKAAKAQSELLEDDTSSETSDEDDHGNRESEAETSNCIISEKESDEEAEGEEEKEEGSEEESEQSDESDEDSESGPDLARGKGNIESSSDEDDENDIEQLLHPEDPEMIEHAWGELDNDAPRGDMVTRRLAVCNLNWDRMKAKDLLALFNSFKPKGGVIFSVKIYPSEYGKERLKAEECQGPVEILSVPENSTEDTEEERVYKEKIRDYQFKRLKYFYAVVECDSEETANKIYEECDGLEYESSCCFIDLRFIPDDVTFDEKPKDVVTDVDLSSYAPKLFTSAVASGTSKVELTWDETDYDRVTSLEKTFKKDELLDLDFQAYLASSSEGDEEEETTQQDETAEESEKKMKSHKGGEDQISKYRELLKSIKDKDSLHENKDMEMEVTWVPGLKESAEEMVKRKLEGKDELTVWERYLQKKKENRKEKKNRKSVKAQAEDKSSDEEIPSDVDFNDPFFVDELGGMGKKKNLKTKKEEKTSEEKAEDERQKAEMALLIMDDEEDRKHFNYDKIVEQQNLSKKKKKKLMKQQDLLEEDNFQVNVADPRFQAMYTSHHFNLDPSNPSFKKTKAMQTILEEKARQREHQQQEQAKPIKRKQELDAESTKQKTDTKKISDPDLSVLIKSVKRKTELFQASKKQKTK